MVILRSRLSNGANVLRWRGDSDSGVTLALCVWPGSEFPYVVWRLDENGNPFSGDYYETREEAETRFEVRKF